MLLPGIMVRIKSMRSWSLFLWLYLIGGVAQAQSPPPEPSKLSVEETLSLAHQKLEHGETKEAIATLEQLAATPRASPKGVQHELGIAYYRSGKLLSAEQAFARAIDENPNDMESVQMRGLTLYRLGRPAAAIPFLERVRQWTPNANADANYVLGLCYLNSQRFDDARAAFASQFAVPPDSGPAYLLLGKMLMQANLPEAAAQAARKALELAPKLPLAHFMLGEFYLFKSDIAQALREFEQEREILRIPPFMTAWVMFTPVLDNINKPRNRSPWPFHSIHRVLDRSSRWARCCCGATILKPRCSIYNMPKRWTRATTSLTPYWDRHTAASSARKKQSRKSIWRRRFMPRVS
jgi:tetratricopeptide (TPR) repeat protein